MNTRIETKTLKYSIEQSEILRDVSISVHNGRMVGIVGPNGSGKTTLLKHIYRALQPMKDTVYINNREMENYSYKESARELTVVKQENSSDFDFTVERMVLLGRSPYRKSFENFTKEDYEIAHRALESVGMTEYTQRSFGRRKTTSTDCPFIGAASRYIHFRRAYQSFGCSLSMEHYVLDKTSRRNSIGCVP